MISGTKNPCQPPTRLSGEALDFVYRQDGSIAQADLPTLDTHFGGTTPGRLAIRSDDGIITLDTFPSSDPESPPPPPILQASETLVLSAPAVALVRTDGQDLVLDEILQAGLENWNFFVPVLGS